jgi:hypothetical protein
MISRNNSSNLNEVLQYKNPNYFQETHFQRENNITPENQQHNPLMIDRPKLVHCQYLSHNQQQNSLELQHNYDTEQISYELLLEETIRRSIDERQSVDSHIMAQRYPSFPDQIHRSHTSDSIPRHPNMRRGSGRGSSSGTPRIPTSTRSGRGQDRERERPCDNSSPT